MKHLLIKNTIPYFLFAIIILIACKKEEDKTVDIIGYKIYGKLDTTKTTITTTRLLNAKFTLAFSNITEQENSDAVLNGTLQLKNYSGIVNKDTLAFFIKKTIGLDTIFVLPNDSARAIKITNNYMFSNYDSAKFSCNNYPILSNFNKGLIDGKGYFRLGRYPKYAFVNIDSVVKF
jgi:hypothetical protein